MRTVPREDQAQRVETIDSVAEEARQPRPNGVEVCSFAMSLSTMVQTLSAVPGPVESVKAALEFVGVKASP